MHISLRQPGPFAYAKIDLLAGERIKAESDAMVSMSPCFTIETELHSGLKESISRRLFGGEDVFFQTITAQHGPGHVLLAPPTVADIVHLTLQAHEQFYVQKSGFLAGSQSLTISTKLQPFAKGLLGGEGFFLLHIQGPGELLLNSYGAIHAVTLAPDESYIVDNAHLVAWSDTTNYEIKTSSRSWLSSLLSGEAFVCRFTGPGTLYLQSRQEPVLPVRSS